MKIGILTFQFADNYGAVLQAYSLLEKLKTYNSHVEVINYISPYFQNAYSINPFLKKGGIGKVKALIKYPLNRCQHDKFIKFRKDSLELKTSTETISGYDTLVVGSDQVWNLDITGEDYTYFGEGIDAKRFVSYAASSKDLAFPYETVRERVSECLNRFHGISVREKKLADELKEMGYFASVVLDPVLLNDRLFWSRVEKKPVSIPQKYILFYALAGNAKLEAVAQQLEKEYGLPILVVHPLARRVTNIGTMKYNIGPKEFLYLIDHAEFVVSNSFHAFAFSCIFGKRIFFDYIPGLSSRVSNLIELLDVEKDIDIYCEIKTVQVDLKANDSYTDALDVSNAFLRNILKNLE